MFHRDSTTSNPVPTEQKDPAITSIAVLNDGFFLTASRSGEKVIKMYKTVRGKIEFVRDFSGHKSGISALATLDRKGRFLSAGMVSLIHAIYFDLFPIHCIMAPFDWQYPG